MDTALIAQHAQLTNQLTALQQSMATLQTDNTTLTTRIGTLEAENTTLTIANTNLTAQVTSLSNAGKGGAAGGAAGGGAAGITTIAFAATLAMVNHQDIINNTTKFWTMVYDEGCKKLISEFDMISNQTVCWNFSWSIQRKIPIT